MIGTGTLKVEGRVVVTLTMERTIPIYSRTPAEEQLLRRETQRSNWVGE